MDADGELSNIDAQAASLRPSFFCSRRPSFPPHLVAIGVRHYSVENALKNVQHTAAAAAATAATAAGQ